MQPAEVFFLLVVDSRPVQILQFGLDFVLHLMSEVFDGLHVDLRLQFLVLFLFSLFAKAFFANTEGDEDRHDRADDGNADDGPFRQSGAGLDRFVLVYHLIPNVLDRALSGAFGNVRFSKSVHPHLPSCTMTAPCPNAWLDIARKLGGGLFLNVLYLVYIGEFSLVSHGLKRRDSAPGQMFIKRRAS